MGDAQYVGSYSAYLGRDDLLELGWVDDTAISTAGGLGTVRTMPYTATGCIIVGCAPESTFTFIATYYVEIIPRPSSSLISLVKPSPAYDPNVYEIYTNVMRRLPIGTYKDDNDFGTWFKGALGLIRGFSPIKLVGGIGTAISNISKAVK